MFSKNHAVGLINVFEYADAEYHEASWLQHVNLAREASITFSISSRAILIDLEQDSRIQG